MRVVFVEPFGVAGLYHYAYNLCEALAATDVDVSLLTASDHELAGRPHGFRLLNRLRLWNPFAGAERRVGLARGFERLAKALRYLSALCVIQVILWRERPDIVHTSEMRFLPDLLLYLVPRRYSVIHTCHNVQRLSETGRSLLRRSWVVRRAQAMMYRRCDGVIFHAAESRDEFGRVFGFQPARWRVIPHGEYGFFAAGRDVTGLEARRALHLPDVGRLVLFFGMVRPYKGLPVLLQAMARLRQDVPDVRLVVAGSLPRGVRPGDLERSARALGVHDVIEWRLGYVPLDEVHLFFRACDVIALPYLKVYDSGVLKIAQALGCPVVVTATGGLPAAVAGGQAGLIVEPGQPTALACALKLLLTDPALAARLAAHGQKLARTEFSWATIARQTADFYRETLGGLCVS